MSDKDNRQSLQEELLVDIENAANSELSEESKSDAVSDESLEEESGTGESNEESEEGSGDSHEGSETKSDELNFDFRETPTSLKNLVNNLKNLSPEERQERISKLSRKAEIEVVKKEFPEAFEAKREINNSEIEALKAQIAELQKLTDTNTLAKLQKLAEQGSLVSSRIEDQIRDGMLKDRLGDSYQEVLNDHKFKEAYNNFSDRDMAERLEVACALSPVARKAFIEAESKRQASLKATKVPSKGMTQASKNMKPKEEVSGKEFITASGMEKYFGDRLAQAEF